MNQDQDHGNNAPVVTPTGLLLAWFTLLLFGPYLTLLGLRIRLDHLLMPLLTLCCLVWGWRRNGRVMLPWLLLVPLGSFILVGLLATLISVTIGGHQFGVGAFLAKFESHARIVMIILAAAQLTPLRIDMPRIIRFLGIAALILAMLGIFQVYRDNEWTFSLAGRFSMAAYEGRFSRGMSVLAACLGKRAVASFYHPGNCALFFCLVVPFLMITDHFRSLARSTYIPCLTVIFLGWGLTISDGFIAGVVLITALMLGTSKFRPTARFYAALAPAILLGIITSPYAVGCYTRLLFQNSLAGYYNAYLGPKFGRIAIASEQGAQAAHCASDKAAGYLKPAFDTIAAHPWLGAGYIPDAMSGDSMFVNLKVTAGNIGLCLFAIFLGVFAVKLVQKCLSSEATDRILYISYLPVLAMFAVFGVSFPTFIQDRTGDVFWWLGTLLLFRVVGTEGAATTCTSNERGICGLSPSEFHQD